MSTMRIGSLFSGVGGLDLGVEHGLGANVAWTVERDAYCRSVLARHWPTAERFDDVHTVGAATLTPVDCIVGGFPCFVAGTLIDTDAGLVPIEQVQIGDRVLTHQKRYQRVRATMARPSAELLRVKAGGVLGITTTSEHPFYARTRTRKWNNERRRYQWEFSSPEWVSAASLTKEHFIAQPLSAPTVGRAWETEAFWYFVGRWLGDGWIIDHPRVGRKNSHMRKAIVCCSHEEADALATAIREAGLHATRAPDRTATKFHITSTELVGFLAPFGRGAHAKRVPGFVFGAPSGVVRALWRGWLESDGYTSDDGCQHVTTVSRELAIGMARIARIATGRASAVSRHSVPATTTIEGRVVNQRPQYTVRVAATSRSGFHENGFCWTPIRTILDLRCRADVFNFEVEEDNSYVADGVVVHNCQPASVAGKRKAQADERWLWPQVARIVGELRPPLCIFENVLGLRTAGMRDVLSDLAALGLDVEWTDLSAFELGAPHLRRRLFFVATDPERVELREQPGWLERACRAAGQAVDRRAAQVAATDSAGWGPEKRTRPSEERRLTEHEHPDAAYADSLRRLEQAWRVATSRGWPVHRGWRFDRTPRVDDVPSRGLVGAMRRAAGNAVVTACAFVVGRAVREAVMIRKVAA